MPTNFVTTNNTATNVAVAFQVSGTTISGSANIQGVCGIGGGFGEEYVNAISGTVDTDGTFTAGFTSIQIPARTLTIQGTVPTSTNDGWSGKVTYTNAGGNSQCAASFDGTFTAVSVPNLQGTFSGTGELTSAYVTSGTAPATGTVYSMSANLTQAGTGDDVPVTGSVQLSGFPCFTTGTTDPQVGSSMESNVLNLNYVMNDGASVQVAATVNNTAGTQVAVSGIYVRGDSCAGNYYISTNSTVNTNPLLLNN